MATVLNSPSPSISPSLSSFHSLNCHSPPPFPTLHFCRLIDSPREQITDAVAVYFLMPTRENIAKICQDCKAQLYDSYYFNFITPISRMLLEDLAKAALEANCVDQISKVKKKNPLYPFSSRSWSPRGGRGGGERERELKSQLILLSFETLVMGVNSRH